MIRTSALEIIDRLCGRTAVVVALLSLLLTVADAAAAPKPEKPDKILARAVKALGGEKALRRAGTWQAEGTATRDGDARTGRYRAGAQAPNRYWGEVELGGGRRAEAFNGTSGWRLDPVAGLHTLTGPEGRDFQALARFRSNRWLDWKKDKARLAYAGAATWQGAAAHKVLLVTRRDVRITLWFDAATGLPVREEFPAGDGVRMFEYADYRTVAGVRLPFSITAGTGHETLRIVLTSVRPGAAPPADRFAYPVPAGRSLPDIQALLKDVGENQSRLERLLDQYAFTEAHVVREFDKQGGLKEKPEETYEITFVRGKQVRRLVAEEGRPLKPSDQAKEDRRIEKQVLEIERDAAKAGPKASRRDRSISIGVGLRTSRLLNPRWERFHEREMVVFDFEPNPDFKPKESAEKLMHKVAGTLWIDPADRQVARFEARLLESYKVGGGLLASVKPGATIVLEQARINDEIWLPSQAEFQLDARALFVGVSFNRLIRYSKYQRFGVESEDKITPPKS